jgi:hypothetical protein
MRSAFVILGLVAAANAVTFKANTGAAKRYALIPLAKKTTSLNLVNTSAHGTSLMLWPMATDFYTRHHKPLRISA